MPFDGVPFVEKRPVRITRAAPSPAPSEAPAKKAFFPSPEPHASPVLRLLREARRMIASPENWTRGAYEVAEERYCAIGALRAAARRIDDTDTFKRAHRMLLQVAIRRGFQSVERMNDDSSHHHVIAAFDEAIRKAECERALPVVLR